jgi:DNA-binding CsgD family transcriptional regulator
MIQIVEKETASNVDALDVLNKQQRIMLYIITMFGIVGATGGILGFYGFQTLVFKFLLIGYDIVFIATFLFYIFGKIKVRTALAIELLYAAFETSCENIAVVDNTDVYSGFLILGNICLLLLILMACVLAYIPSNTIIVSLLVVSVFMYCVLKDKHGALTELSVFYLLMIISVSLICWHISRNLLALRTDNIDMREREVQLISALGLNYNQLLKIAQLSNLQTRDEDDDKTSINSFLDTINAETRQRMMAALKDYLLSKQNDMNNLKKVFPMLTPSELEIAKLIVEGKTTGEICRALDKTKSNVGSQRAHIRIKLGLPPEYNLKEALMEKVQHAKL